MKILKYIIFFILVSCSIVNADYMNDLIITGTSGIWTDSRSFTDLSTAISTIGADNVDLYITENEICTTLTIPANVRLHFIKDGAISNSGQLTINTKSIESNNHQIFKGTGDIDFTNGSYVKSAWFADIEEAIDVTNDDYLTLEISEQDYLDGDAAVGNNVTLKWNATVNKIIVNSGVTLSNVHLIEAGNYQLFAGAGDIDFAENTTLHSSWFRRLRSILTWVESENIKVILDGSVNLDLSDSSPSNIFYDATNGYFNIDNGVVLTLPDRNHIIYNSNTQISIGLGTITYTNNLNKLVYVDTLSDLGMFVANTGDSVYINGRTFDGDGGQGVWVLTAGDFTAQLAADTLNGLYLEYSGEDGSARAWVRQYSGYINVKWFGATGNGTTNDRDAIYAAVMISNDVAIQGITDPLNGIASYTMPTIFFPRGIYHCDSYITPQVTQSLGFKRLLGDNAIFEAASGVVLFGGVGSDMVFDGLQFHAGAIAVQVDTGSVDASKIKITNCKFVSQTTAAIQSTSSAGGTQLIVENCEFVTSYSSPGGAILDGGPADSTRFTNCWGSIRNDSGVAFKSTGRLVVDNCVFVPIVALSAWFECYGHLQIDKCTFGGESGGADNIINCHTAPYVVYPQTPNELSVKNSFMYTLGSAIVFYDLPNVVLFKDNVGFVSSLPLTIDSTVPTASLDNIGSLYSVWDVSDAAIQYGQYVSSTLDKAKLGLPLDHIKHRPVMDILPTVSDIILNVQGYVGAYGVSASGTATLNSADTDRYGINAYTVTGTADDQSYTINYATMLNGVSAGVYTLALKVKVPQNQSIKLFVSAGNTREEFAVLPGEHVVNMPFYYNGTSPQSVSVLGFVDNGDSYTISRHVLMSGRRVSTGVGLLMEDTAAPVAGPSLGWSWYKGDRIVNTGFAIGSPKAWVCTVSGAPGTWTSEGNL